MNNKFLKKKIFNWLIEIFYKIDEKLETEIFKNIEIEYKKLVDFFGFNPNKKIKIKLLYKREEMDELVWEKNNFSALVDNKNPYLIYIFSPIFFEEITLNNPSHIIPIITHELAHTFVTKINTRCFSWLNEWTCDLVSEELENVIKLDNWKWFRENNILINTEISWLKLVEHQWYRISLNLADYICKIYWKEKLFELLKIRRIKKINIYKKMSEIIWKDFEEFLNDFEKTIILK